MNRSTRKVLTLAGALVALSVAGCTDTVVEPTSTITDANIFNDPASYKAFLAKVYAGLAVSGQQGPAGQPDIRASTRASRSTSASYWEAQTLPTDEAVIGWGDVGLPEMNTQLWASSNSFVVAMYYRIYFQVGDGERIPAPDDGCQAVGAGRFERRSGPRSTRIARRPDSSGRSATGTQSICSATSRS